MQYSRIAIQHKPKNSYVFATTIRRNLTCTWTTNFGRSPGISCKYFDWSKWLHFQDALNTITMIPMQFTGLPELRRKWSQWLESNHRMIAAQKDGIRQHPPVPRNRFGKFQNCFEFDKQRTWEDQFTMVPRRHTFACDKKKPQMIAFLHPQNNDCAYTRFC